MGGLLRAGQALLEVTKPRGPCMALDVYGPAIKAEIYDDQVRALDPASPRWGMSGLYTSVIEPGAVRRGDIIAIVA